MGTCKSRRPCSHNAQPSQDWRRGSPMNLPWRLRRQNKPRSSRKQKFGKWADQTGGNLWKSAGIAHGRSFRLVSYRFQAGGEGGIRTHGTRKGSTVFETARFNRSRTSPFPLSYHFTAVWQNTGEPAVSSVRVVDGGGRERPRDAWASRNPCARPAGGTMPVMSRALEMYGRAGFGRTGP